MKNNIFQLLEELLKNNSKYLSKDKKILKPVVYNDVMNMNKELISLLMSNEEIKNSFFVQVNDNWIFDKNKFVWFLNSKEFLPDSYTRFSNKIGLSTFSGGGGHYLMKI
ncbi:site-specific DNA-methyltransferase [Metamycoplasma hyosynoviae]|uniref:site-specific DNA-methyltransferase n=1 Tax=Metamycoplasma hyosynoviae TaxID=29559 RepID=UPI0023583969|nr:site-specific DNA-methyltransferase [Metamycoplasma hyosynoviae]MDC8937879.1 site-specific DNA-methyltransferase [Metamycoplasma hyosynoviae]